MRVPQLWSGEAYAERPRTAFEMAVLAAPSISPEGLQEILGKAVEEGRRDAGAPDGGVAPEALARARVDLLGAVERPRGASFVSPWFGFTGVRDGEDGQALWITHAEATGTCPWREFVEHRLGVLPMPDPLLGLPGIDGLLVGQVVHGVLEDIVEDVLATAAADGSSTFDRIMARVPKIIPWPGAERFEELVSLHSRRVAARAGLEPVGLAPMLAARARVFLEVARDLEFSSGALPGVMGSEVEGSVVVAGVSRPVAFRADRVDGNDGVITLVDYKAARPASEAKKEAKRREHLMAGIARGRRLQASAYACVAGTETARGEYVYLKPGDEWSPEARVVAVAGDDEEIHEIFVNAVQTIDAARARGIAFPRVEEADGKAALHCAYCAVAEACRRDDSAFRRDLVGWMNESEPSGDETIEAARWLWWLGFEQPGEDG